MLLQQRRTVNHTGKLPFLFLRDRVVKCTSGGNSAVRTVVGGRCASCLNMGTKRPTLSR